MAVPWPLGNALHIFVQLPHLIICLLLQLTADMAVDMQGSSSFSYFAWADSSAGYKWGRALPEFCLDEAWPNGGVGGKYINDPKRCALRPDPWSMHQGPRLVTSPGLVMLHHAV
jgi:hypothetical protein